jgi:hydroxyethylthiazole kinase-like uncharacterized protein yjeF
LVDIDPADTVFSGYPALEGFSAIGIGPGLGCRQNSKTALHDLITEVKAPMIIDADALNMLSANSQWISELLPSTILTPHPGEFERLAGKTASGYQRHRRQIEFSKTNNVIVILKGAHTSISFPGGRCYFNMTGNPGMATAGSGDVLTGIILSLLAQGYIPEEAALLGVYLHGLAGDIALQECSEEALIAGDITEHLGSAFRQIKQYR